MGKYQSVNKPKKVVKRAFYLAWIACKRTQGMGFLKNCPNASEEEVWNNVQTNGDYPSIKRKKEKRKEFADYVFGRMMKLALEWDGKYVFYPERKPSISYQSWCTQYENYEKLLITADASLLVEDDFDPELQSKIIENTNLYDDLNAQETNI